MFEIIKKNAVKVLWTISLTILFGSIMIAETNPFSKTASSFIVGTSFNLALLAMIFSAIQKKDKETRFRVVIYLISMVIVTLYVIFR